jgi:hypothetical protein
MFEKYEIGKLSLVRISLVAASSGLKEIALLFEVIVL